MTAKQTIYPMQELIHSIAEKLNWTVDDHRPYNIKYGRCMEPVAAFEIERELIHDFTAYAKAEMAKRGYHLEVNQRYGKYDHYSIVDQYGDNITEWYYFDPTDPLQESKAILLAINEALEMDQKKKPTMDEWIHWVDRVEGQWATEEDIKEI